MLGCVFGALCEPAESYEEYSHERVGRVTHLVHTRYTTCNANRPHSLRPTRVSYAEWILIKLVGQRNWYTLYKKCAEFFGHSTTHLSLKLYIFIYPTLIPNNMSLKTWVQLKRGKGKRVVWSVPTIFSLPDDFPEIPPRTVRKVENIYHSVRKYDDRL